MKILVTGSNGLLGQKLVELITLQTDHQLLATARGENRLVVEGHSFDYQSLDVTNPEEVMAVIGQFKPDAIINTAGMTNVDQCESDHEGCDALNITAVQNLVAAAECHNAFLLHLSTDFIFDGLAGPYDENAEPAPLSYYGNSKLKGELVVRQSSACWAIARTVLVYGIAQNMSRSNIILWVKSSLEAGKAIQVVDDQWRTPTLAEDLAKGCLLIAEQQATGIFNLSGSDLMTPYEMAQATAKFFNLDASLINRADSSTFTQPAKRPPRTGFIIDKAVNQLGYKPHGFIDGMAYMAAQLAKLSQ